MLTAILPASGQFDAVKASLSASWLANFDATAEQLSVGVYLPKFNLSGSSVSWLTALKALGITKLFDPGQSDLSGITQDESLYVKDVLQQVYVDVSEQGTEAAAATAVTVVRVAIAGAGEPLVIAFDRPFLFFVRERSGPVLLAGQVMTLPAT